MTSKGVALVTGAGQGIGRAIALRLAEDGFDVAVNDISGKNLEELVQEIELKQRKSSFHVADVTKEEEVKDLIAKVVQQHGSFNVVTTEDDWDKLFAVNGKGVFFCYKYAGEQMIFQGHGGRIIGASAILGNEVRAIKGTVQSLTKL
ncbi:hypothetical protein H0H92_004054 [Tricholoma furcatifolium]|nr:hypothetical protein H0H92_004054 [Tricholoma furcatifolium]